MPMTIIRIRLTVAEQTIIIITSCVVPYNFVLSVHIINDTTNSTIWTQN